MSAWVINRSAVSHDLLEGEVIAIHLGTGIYYSLRGTAAVIWPLLEAPVEAGAVARAVAAGFGVAPEVAGREVGAFLEKLRAEDLILATTAEAMRVPEPVAARQDYAPPVLERFADLQDLLLLDPIHDVGAQGWPHRPPPPPAAG